MRLLLAIFLSASFVFADEPALPKVKAKESATAKDKGEWFGKKVLPQRDPDKILMGDWKDDKQEFWKPHNINTCIVREDTDSWLRLYDGHREGWVKKEDMVIAEDAPAWWGKVVKEKPGDYRGWIMRGMCWNELNSYDKAIKDLDEAIRLNADADAAYNCRGISWAQKNDYDKAIADYTEAIRLDPKGEVYFNNRGNAWREKKEYDKSIVDLTEAIRLDPKYATAYHNRGLTLVDQQEYGKALSDFTIAIRHDPKNPVFYNNRGNTWDNKKEYAKAIADYTEAIRLAPKDDSAINNIAWLLATCTDPKFRDGKKAVEYGKKAVELNPFWNNHCTLAAAYAEIGHFEAALKEQQITIDLLKADKSTNAEIVKRFEARLELYRNKKPYRDE